MKKLLTLLFTIILPLFSWGQGIAFPKIPALSYHNVRGFTTQNPAYFITPERFENHLHQLKDYGYRTILPEEVERIVLDGKEGNEKVVLISFDDTRADHFTNAAPLLEKYGFRGVFYIMTVSIGKPGYMSKAQIRELAERGHSIGLHTWDHQDLRKISEDQWRVQLDQPKALLEEITGKTITSLAYPYGLWNHGIIQQLKNREIRTAFQLGGKMDPNDPVFSLPRILVPGNWSGDRLIEEIERTF